MALAFAAMRCATGATASLLPAARSWAVSMLTSGLDHGLGASVLGGGPLPGLLARARHDSALAQRASEQVVPPEILRELQQLGELDYDQRAGIRALGVLGQRCSAPRARRIQCIWVPLGVRSFVDRPRGGSRLFAEGSLNDAARLDGRRRSSLRLSQSTLPLPLPTHTVEPGLPALDAHVRPRSATGGTACKWLRRAGRVPGRVHSLPGADARAGAAAGHSEDQGASSSSSNINNNNNKLLVHFSEGDVAKLIRTFGRNGCTARVLQLNLVAPDAAASDSGAEQAAQADAGRSGEGTSGSTSGRQLGMLRVKPTRVFVNAVTQRVEGLDLIYCPPERQVLVDVPVRLLNDDLAPGVKKGGWIALFKRTVRYKALGSAIPPYIEVNVRNMDLDQDMLVRDMPIPPGTKLYEKDYNAPVLRCTTDVGKD